MHVRVYGTCESQTRLGGGWVYERVGIPHLHPEILYPSIPIPLGVYFQLRSGLIDISGRFGQGGVVWKSSQHEKFRDDIGEDLC